MLHRTEFSSCGVECNNVSVLQGVDFHNVVYSATKCVAKLRVDTNVVYSATNIIVLHRLELHKCCV